MQFKIMVETLQNYTIPIHVDNVQNLIDYLIAQKIQRVSFRTSNVFEGPSRCYNEKNVLDITEDDLTWLSKKEPYGVRSLVIESVSV
jgi:hypothetical protein